MSGRCRSHCEKDEGLVWSFQKLLTNRANVQALRDIGLEIKSSHIRTP